MTDPRTTTEVRSVADITSRIVVKGIVDREKIPRIVVKGIVPDDLRVAVAKAAGGAKFVVSGAQDASSVLSRAYDEAVSRIKSGIIVPDIRDTMSRVTDFGAIQAAAAGMTLQADAIRHAALMDHVGLATKLDVLNKADLANKAALGIMSTEAKLWQTDSGCSRVIDAVKGIEANAVQRAFEAFHAADRSRQAVFDVVHGMTTQDYVSRAFLEQARAERSAFSTLMYSTYSQDISRLSAAFDFSKITAQISAGYDAIAAALRFSPDRLYTDPIVDDMLILVDPDVSDAERDAALDRVAMWFVQQRLSYRTRTIVRRLNQATLQATILLVINGEEFSRLGPWDAKDEMPKLVLANLDERPTTKTWNGAPIYRVSGRKERASDADLRPYQPHQIYQAQPQLDALIAEWSAGDLRRVIERSNLTRDERRLVELLLNEGLTIRAAAQELGIDEKAAMMRRKRAQGKLKATRERDQKQQQRVRRRRNT